MYDYLRRVYLMAMFFFHFCPIGDCITGAFVNNDKLWEQLQAAGSLTGDRVWRLPLLKHYTKMVTGEWFWQLHAV